MVFMGDQSLPTEYKRGGTVENYLPFYYHQGEGGHKNITKLWGGGGITELKQIRPFEISFLTCSQTSIFYLLSLQRLLRDNV